MDVFDDTKPIRIACFTPMIKLPVANALHKINHNPKN